MNRISNLMRGFLIGAVICIAIGSLDACKKSEPQPFGDKIEAHKAITELPAPKAIAVPSSTDTTASTAATAPATTTVAAVAPVKPKLKHAQSTAESSAYKLAYANAARANQLLGEHRYKVSAADHG